MTSTGSTPPTLRLLVVDPRAFASFDQETLHRVADRIGGQRPRLVFAGVGARPEPELPDPDYLIADGGERITRLATGEAAAGWPLARRRRRAG